MGTHALPRTGFDPSEQPTRSGITLLGTTALVLVSLGGLNWGLVGLAGIDAVAWLFGSMSVAARTIDVVFGAAALYCLARLPRWSSAG